MKKLIALMLLSTFACAKDLQMQIPGRLFPALRQGFTIPAANYA